jgi:23S rRNA (guanosine2251-2'-O)-methyltransferase
MRTVVGIHACREALKINLKSVTEVWVKEKSEKNPDLVQFIEIANKNKIKCFPKPEAAFSRIAQSTQGIAVFLKTTPELDLETLAPDENAEQPEKTILIALDEMTDPHNLGAILRTAWLMDVKAILIPGHRSVGLSPAAAKVASGGAEHVPVVTVNSLPNTLRDLKDKGFWIYGLAAEGASAVNKVSFPERVVLVIGAEDKGLRTTVQSACDECVMIPQTDNEASYNASVAAAIALFEVRRQHNFTNN